MSKVTTSPQDDNTDPFESLPFNIRGTVRNIQSRKGKISAVHYRKELTPKKKFQTYGLKIEKESFFKVRAGIDYNNQMVVKEGHASGEIEVKPLPASLQVITTGVYHNTKKETYMVGCSPMSGDNNPRITKFYVDGKEVTLEDTVISNDDEEKTLKEILYKGDFNSSSEKGNWVMLNVDSIVSLSGC